MSSKHVQQSYQECLEQTSEVQRSYRENRESIPEVQDLSNYHDIVPLDDIHIETRAYVRKGTMYYLKEKKQQHFAFCICWLLVVLFVIILWTVVLPKPCANTFGNTPCEVYDRVECSYADCVIKFDGSICTIGFVNSTLSSCPINYNECTNEPQYVKCDFDYDTNCPYNECWKYDKSESTKRYINLVFFLIAVGSVPGLLCCYWCAEHDMARIKSFD